MPAFQKKDFGFDADCAVKSSMGKVDSSPFGAEAFAAERDLGLGAFGGYEAERDLGLGAFGGYEAKAFAAERDPVKAKTSAAKRTHY